MPEPAGGAAAGDARARRRRTSRTTSPTSSSQQFRTRRASTAAGCACATTIDLEAAEDRARGDRQGAAARRSARRPRSSRSTRTPARCSRWSAAGTTTRASSTSRRRASASRARRSSRSCSRRRCKSGISPSTTFDSKPVTIDAGGRRWRSRTTRASTSARSTCDRRSRTPTTRSSRSSRTSSGRRTSPPRRRRSGSRRRCNGVLLDRPRRRAGDAARDGARLRDASRTAATASTARSSGTQPRVVDVPRGRRRATCTTDNATVPHRGARRTGSADDRGPAAPGRRQLRDGHGGARSRAARSPARPARPRTTATPGSSATRRDLVTAVWVGYPNELRPMLTEYHGRAGRRRHLPGADLEGVHGEGAASRTASFDPPTRRRRRGRSATALGATTALPRHVGSQRVVVGCARRGRGGSSSDNGSTRTGDDVYERRCSGSSRRRRGSLASARCARVIVGSVHGVVPRSSGCSQARARLRSCSSRLASRRRRRPRCRAATPACGRAAALNGRLRKRDPRGRSATDARPPS